MRRRLVTFLVALLCYATAILYVHHGTSRLPRPRSASTPAASAAVNPAAPPATPAALRTTPAPPSGTQHAFALVLGPRTSIDAAVVIAHSLARTSECVQQRRCALLLLLTPGAPPLTHDQQLQLQQRAWHAIQPAAVPPPLRALPPEHAPSLARLALWGLTTYSRVVAVPDDAVVLRSPDALLRFAVPNGTRLATGASAARAAAPGPAAGLGDDVAVVFPEDLTFRALGAGYHALWERDPRQPPQRLLGAALRGVPCVPLPDAVSEATPAPADAWGHLTVLRYSAPRPWEFAGGAAERGAVRAGEAFALWWELYEDHHRGVWEGGGGDGAGAGAVIGSAGNGAVAWGDPHSVRYSGFFAAAAGEGPPGPGTHLWLARSTPHSYLRRLPSAERRARNLTLPGLLLLTSLPGEHCDKYCYKRQDACAPGALSFSNVNDCRALRRVYNCSVCLYDAAAPWAPAFDTATQVCIASHPAVAPAPGALSCNVTSPKGLRRLCPCVPTDSYYEPPVPYVPRDPFTLPSRPLAEAAALGDYAAERARHPSGCYPAITDYTAESDAECTRYLSNWSNVQAVTVMAATGLLGRTVKFRVVYKEPGVRALLKVPQEFFIWEAHNEVVCWAIDRMLGIARVPPVGWLSVPVAVLEDAVKAAGDAELSEWVTEVFFSHIRRQRLVGAGAVVGGSAQLWMADIHRLDVSVYAVPFGRWVSWFTPGAPQPPLPERRAAMPFLADQTVFDYVIGNDDRNTNKNNYVAGGCKWTCLRAGPEPQHLGPPTFVHLDHGKAFYKTGDPDFVALSAKNNTFCKYGNRTYQALRGYDGAWGAFERDLRARVRPGIYSYIPARHYRAAHARLEKWLKHVRACEAAYGHDAVFPWP